MANYDFTACLSPLDFELLSKDLLEAELGIQLENFREGPDRGIDLRYAPARSAGRSVFNSAALTRSREPPQLIVQCKRYSSFASLKSELKSKELAKISKLNPTRYILTTSVSLTPQQADELKAVLSPFVQSTGDIYGKERLNSALTNHPEVERRHIKLWVESAGVLDSIINAGTHIVSREEIERTIAAAKIYVRNPSFDEALDILKQHRVCIISGQPGIGKTTLARMLLLYYHEKGYDLVKIESDISEARAVGYHNKPRFFYYDDFLGQTAQADKLNKNEDQKLLDFMASVRDSKESVFVLTTREYILNQARLHYEKLDREKFDQRTCVIDLTKYSRRIRAQILYNHLHFSSLPRQHLECLVAKRGYIRIIDHKNYNPRLIQYLTDLAWIGDTPSSEYLDLFIRNLDNPVEIWGHAFRNQLSDKARHLLFVLTTMPTEMLVRDAEQAFTAFHITQCARFGIKHSATDFMTALKELDGTFIATRNINNTLLIRFQNPSIRDFMQALLLGGEQLSEIIDTLVFFEQAQWFLNTLDDDRPRVSLEALASHAYAVIDALKRLVDAESCSFYVTRMVNQTPVILKRNANPAERFAVVATNIASQSGRNDSAWIEARILGLSSRVMDGTLSPSAFDAPIHELANLGCLYTNAGAQLVTALKQQALLDPDSLDEFETLGNLVSAAKQFFTDSELDSVRQIYLVFSQEFAEDCDISSPDEIREDALRIGHIGELLGVNTNNAQEKLRELADQIESEQEHAEEDDDRHWGGISEDCKDGELDSMFSTLRD